MESAVYSTYMKTFKTAGRAASCGGKAHEPQSNCSTALERLNDMPVVYRPVPVSNCSCKYVNNFYRATLRVSTVLAVGRCLSVTPVYCIQTAKDIVNLSYRPDSPVILVFEPIGVTQFQGAPFVE